MAQEVIVFKTCDRHAAKGERVEGETIPPVTIGKVKPRVAELCAQCHADILAPLVEFLDELGRYEDSGRRTRKRTPEVAPQEPDSDGVYKCPDCDDTFPNPQGRGAHRYAKHGYRSGDDD